MKEYSFATRTLQQLCADYDDSHFEVVLDQYMRNHIKKEYNDVMVTSVVVNRNPDDSDEWVEATVFAKVYEFDKGEVESERSE